MIDRPSLRPVLTAQPRAGLDRLPQLRLATVGFLLLLVLVVAQAVRGFTDSDYFWHYRAGEYIVTHHAVPHADIFTFSAYGRHWVAHEWLSEALIYSLVKLGGYGLAIVVFTLSPVLAVVLLYRLLEKEGVSARALLPVLVIASLMIAIYTTVRPQVLSWAGFAALFSALYAYHGGRIQRLWGLPPLFALWANLHLSVIVGLGIFGLFALATAGNQWLRKQPFRLGHPLLVLVLSVAAACINPNGPRLLLYPLEYLPLQGTILPAVAEWKSPDFHSYIFLPLLAGVILLAIVGLSGRRLDLWPVGLGIVAIALGLQSVRWVPVFSLAFAPLAGRALAERWSWALAGNEAPPDSRRSRFHWLLLLVVLAVLVIALRPGAGSQLRSSPRTKGQLVPVDAVNFIADQYPDARIFNQYEWGGYLIYRLWPRNHVLVDGRNDMFDAHFLEDYLHAFSAQRGWQGFLDRYGITVVMVRADSSMAGALETNPRWRLGFQDNLSVVYVRQ